MIVMSRQQGQGILLGESIRVTVIDVKGDRVRIGIEAPADANLQQHNLSVCKPQDQTPGQDHERTS